MNEPKKNQKHADASEALKSVGLQVTGQRTAVYNEVQTNPHSTADEVHQAVIASFGAVSRQAVYDALNMMAEYGLIRRIQPAGSPARYERRLDNHHHLVCRKCNSVIDVDCFVGSAPCLKVKSGHGYVIEETEVTYWGICPKCQKSSSTKETKK